MITWIADVHIDNYPKDGGPDVGGLNDRGRKILGVLDQAVSHAAGGPLVILGDLFNQCQPAPALIYHTQQILSQHDDRTFIMLGNHDLESDIEGHNALAPLSPVATIVNRGCTFDADDVTVWLVPFKAGPTAEWLPKALESMHALEDSYHRNTHGRRVLGLHVGLSDDRTPYYLDNAQGSIRVKTLARLCKEYGITHVFSGDWHRHKVWKVQGVTLVQVGALCPNRFPPNYEHGHRGPIVQLHGGHGLKIKVEDIPGPRFYKLQWSQVRNDIEKGVVWSPGDDADPAYVKLTCRSDQVDDAREWGESLKVELGLLKAGGRLATLEYAVDRGIERAKARTASFEARQASSLDEAIALYIKSMPVDEVVNRDAVIQHVRRLLG